ncbi:MAG: S-layer homology domain-containing protein [Tumebacillaceae bacterium]
MIRSQRRLVSFIMTLLLIFTLLPVMQTQASVAYFTFPWASSPANAINNPVNVGVIDQFNGSFSQTVPSQLSYSVQQMQQATDGSGAWYAVGTPRTSPNATPIISGPTNQDFTFTNVQLFEGMNKVTVTTPDGTEGTCYIYYDAAPVIYNITLANGQTLSPSSPAIVDQQNQFLNIQTANAQTVSVGTVNASKYGPNSFAIANYPLTPGLNTLTFVAKTDKRSYTITRQIVYNASPGTLYKNYLQDATTHTNGIALDGFPTLTQNPLPQELTGYLIVPSSGNSVHTKPTINQLAIARDNTAVLSQANLTNAANVLNSQTQFVQDDGAGHLIFKYTITLDNSVFALPPSGWPINSAGTYNITMIGTFVNGSASGGNFTSTILFSFKDGSNPTINQVQQLFGVDTATGRGGVASPFATSMSALPIYARLNLTVPAGKTATATVEATQDGVTKPVNFTLLAADPNDPVDSQRVRLDSLPFVGNMTLTFSITDGANFTYDTYTTGTFSYIPTPSIAINQIYDGLNVGTPDLPAFNGNLYNFTAADLLQPLTFTVNGVDQTAHLHVNAATASFSVDQLIGVLNPGANDIKIAATAQGVPIYTRVTVYYFTSASGSILDPYPVPVSLPPAAPATKDVNNLFPATDAAHTFNTTEKVADIIFGISNADTAVVMNNGQQYFKLDFDATGNLTTTTPFTVSGPTAQISEVSALEPNPQTSPKTYYFRISNFPLTLGTNSLVVKALKGPTSVFTPLSIIRTLPPYQVLSPKLPEERVVNQNYVPVTIRADGADSVSINKVAMAKTTDPVSGQDFFNLEVSNLKPGNNTIKYTVVRGQQKINDQFDVYFASTNTIGAQYKAPLPTSGSISAFNKAVTLSFPKGTLLSPFNDPSTKLELFDKHQFLFGIADPNDGRTQKTFNTRGVISPIYGFNNNFMQTMLDVPQHFGYASQLYWVDAGYYDTTVPGYVQLDGMHPYSGVERGAPNQDLTQYDVWGRTSGSQWLKPTTRGTITMSYDPAIRDQSATKVSIWRFGLKDDGFIGWSNIGGKVDTSKHTVSASVDAFGYFAVMYNTYDFDDTEGHAFARDAMELLYARGLMNSKDGDTFGAYESTTRGEFAEMMVKALDLPLDYDAKNPLFLDVPHSLYVSPYWDWRYIETAGQKGIVRGVGTRVFAPNDTLTREQAAVMIAMAMNLKLTSDVNVSKKNLDKVFADSGQVGTYARTSVEAVYKAKLMVGAPVSATSKLFNFNPKSNMTRAEVAVVVMNMMKTYKRL